MILRNYTINLIEFDEIRFDSRDNTYLALMPSLKTFMNHDRECQFLSIVLTDICLGKMTRIFFKNYSTNF